MIDLKALAGSVILVGVLAGAHAQEVPLVPTLEPMIIRADPLERAEASMVRPVSVLKREHILTRDLRNIGETVSQELGVSASDFGPGAGRPVIRGLGGPRVRVLENGIGAMDVSTISPDHAVALEPLFAEQIEILRGPSTLLYGSGASGGIVNVVNHRILDAVPEDINGDLYGHYNSVADDFTGAFRLNAGAGNFAFHLDGMKRHTQDYSIPGYADAVPEHGARRGVLKNSDIRAENFSGGVSYVGEQGFLGVAVSRFRNHYGVPGHDHPHAEGEDGHDDHDGHDHHEHEDHENHDDVRVKQRQTRFDIKGAVYDPLPGLKMVKTRWGYNDHTHKELEGHEVGTLLNNREWEGRVEMLHQPLAGWDGVLGLQYQDRNLSTAGEEAFVPGSRSDAISVFMLEKRALGRWHFELGGRYEHQQAMRKADDFKVSHDAVSISGGANWAFLDGYALGTSITHAQRAPALEELFSNGPHFATGSFEVGNTSLRKEKSNNFDVYVRRRDGYLDWTLNLFANLIDDFIYLQAVDRAGDGLADRVDREGRLDGDGLLLLNYHQTNARLLGVEFETIAHLLNDNRGKLDVRLWTDYVRGRLSGGESVPRMTPLRFGGVLNYGRGPWRGIVDVMRVHKQTHAAALETATAGYTMLNIQLGYTLEGQAANYSIFVRGANLLNEEARRHASFLKDRAPLPGRSAMVGMHVNF